MIGHSGYPNTIDTFDTLLRLGLGVRTYLKQPIDADTMTLRVGDPSLLSQPTGVIRLDNEWITYSALVGDLMTVEARGAFLDEGGYQASPHRDGAPIVQAMTPMHHRVLAEAIIALQTNVVEEDHFTGYDTDRWEQAGTGSSDLITSPFPGHPGLLRLLTGAVSLNNRYIQRGGEFGSADYALMRFVWIGCYNNATSAMTMRVGHMDQISGSRTGVYIESENAEANWYSVSSISGSEDRVDTGLAAKIADTPWLLELRRVDDDTVTLKVVNLATMAQFQHDIVLPPSIQQFAVFYVETHEAAAKDIAVDAWKAVWRNIYGV